MDMMTPTTVSNTAIDCVALCTMNHLSGPPPFGADGGGLPYRAMITPKGAIRSHAAPISTAWRTSRLGTVYSAAPNGSCTGRTRVEVENEGVDVTVAPM
eukprot:6147950-Prymnesium_polylepis.2